MANIQKFCPKGHAYDSSLPACPYCSPSQNDDKSTKTDTLVQENNKCKLCPKGHYYPSFLPECPFCPSKKIVEPPPPGVETLIDPLLPHHQVRPVLVCLQGSDFGKDFELYPNVTHIGLDASQGVCLSDKNVSPEHFTIFYDKKHNRYFADIDTDSTPVYINDHLLDTRTELKWGDQIKVGETLLGFIPLGQKVESLSVRPVVGWLVCVQGPDIGKDFRLHSDFNHVGRDKYQDVCLSDKTVSREHFAIAHDRMNNLYFVEMNNKGRTMVYINGYSLGEKALLKKGDQIKVGETELVFIPLEQKDVKWTYELER